MTVNARSTILGLDVGDVRVGVSIARGGRSPAIPLVAFNRAKGEAEDKILSLIRDEEITLLICGLPLSDSGNETPQCEKVRNFCRRLAKRADLEVVFVDEYASSAEARQKLFGTPGRRKYDRKSGIIDAVSASIILQYYLDTLD